MNVLQAMMVLSGQDRKLRPRVEPDITFGEGAIKRFGDQISPAPDTPPDIEDLEKLFALVAKDRSDVPPSPLPPPIPEAPGADIVWPDFEVLGPDMPDKEIKIPGADIYKPEMDEELVDEVGKGWVIRPKRIAPDMSSPNDLFGKGSSGLDINGMEENARREAEIREMRRRAQEQADWEQRQKWKTEGYGVSVRPSEKGLGVSATNEAGRKSLKAEYRNVPTLNDLMMRNSLADKTSIRKRPAYVSPVEVIKKQIPVLSHFKSKMKLNELQMIPFVKRYGATLRDLVARGIPTAEIIKTIYQMGVQNTQEQKLRGRSSFRDMGEQLGPSEDLLTNSSERIERIFQIARQMESDVKIEEEEINKVATEPVKTKKEKERWESNLSPEAKAWMARMRTLSAKGITTVQENGKTVVSIDFSTTCPMREKGKCGACLYCYVDHGRIAKKLGIAFINGKRFLENDYKHELLSMPQDLVMKINSELGGMRMFAFGDYRRGIDDKNIQMVLEDAKKIGLIVKAITKQLDFVAKYGNHPNLRINISTDYVPREFSNAPSVDRAWEAKAGRENIQIRTVALTLAHALNALKDDRIAVLTLYHGPEGDDLIKVVRVQNPKAFEMIGEEKLTAFLRTWQNMTTLKSEGKEANERFNTVWSQAKNRVCCGGGKCSKDQTKCGFWNNKKQLAKVIEINDFNQFGIWA